MSKKITFFSSIILALAVYSSLCQARTFVKVPGTGIIKKVVAAFDNISATSEKGRGNVVFYKMGMLKPYFVMAEDKQYYKISDQQNSSGKVGYVKKAHTRQWNTREGLRFIPRLLAMDERPTIKVWKDLATISGYARTGDQTRYKPVFGEEKLRSRTLTRVLRPYPVIGKRMVETTAEMDKTIYNVLVPAYIPDTNIKTDLTPTEIRKVISSITFCIIFDATASMKPYALDMANIIEELLDSLLRNRTKGEIRAGFIFFRDIGDAQPYWIEQPMKMEVATDMLKNAANKMSGGGDEPEPVLDAAYLATTNEFDWGEGTIQTGAKKVAIVVLNAAAKPTTIGLSSKIAQGLRVGEVANLLNNKNIVVYGLQAGEEDTGNLTNTLSVLTRTTDGEFYRAETAPKRQFVSSIDTMMKETVVGYGKKGRKISSYAIPGKDWSVLPLKVVDADTLIRLREAAEKFEVIEGGLVIQEGWMFEQNALYQEQVLIGKRTLEQLIRLFNILSDMSLDGTTIKQAARTNLEAMIGERIPKNAEIQELIEKRMGLHFNSNILSFSFELFDGLVPKEKARLQSRIGRAGKKLSNFLESAASDFHKQPLVWMKLSYLP